jgi:hypothetical protein
MTEPAFVVGQHSDRILLKEPRWRKHIMAAMFVAGLLCSPVTCRPPVTSALRSRYCPTCPRYQPGIGLSAQDQPELSSVTNSTIRLLRREVTAQQIHIDWNFRRLSDGRAIAQLLHTTTIFSSAQHGGNSSHVSRNIIPISRSSSTSTAD